MSIEKEITQRLQIGELEPSEKLGQNFLVDEAVIQYISSLVIRGGRVIEIGAGIGQLTEAIAAKASKVIGIEIDSRFQPVLRELSERDPKVSIVISDALEVNLAPLAEGEDDVQIISNLPFHITEPFLSKIVDLPVEDVILLLGDSAAQEINETEDSPYYGKLSLIVQTFFDFRKLCNVPKTSFYPQPRTDAALIELTPKEKEEIQADPANFVFAYLIRRANKHGLVLNELKQALVEASRVSSKGILSKREINQKMRSNVRRDLKQLLKEYENSGKVGGEFSQRKRNRNVIISQSDALERIAETGIDINMLQRPFFTLNNQELRELVKVVKQIFSKKSKRISRLPAMESDQDFSETICGS